MILQAKIIIATGQFQNITIEVPLDTDKIEETKAIIRALHKHFYGLLDSDYQEEKKDLR